MSVDNNQLMPNTVRLGQHMQSVILQPMGNWRDKAHPTPNNFGYREVMGYFLPSWQRGLVWSDEQKIKLIESLWLGLNIGTYTFNRSKKFGGKNDNLLIDGQQRLWAIQCYLSDDFPVFGYLWSEVTPIDRRMFEMRHFPCYITESDDEQYLRNYYNMMNFGGTAHKESERA